MGQMSEDFDIPGDIPEMEFIPIIFPDGTKCSFMLPTDVSNKGRLAAEELGLSFNYYVLLLCRKELDADLEA